MKKFDPKVFRLGYVALATADIERTKEHYLEAIGLTQTAKGDDGSVFLSVGYDQHNIVLSPAGGKALRHVGFQLSPGIAVAEFAKEVRAFGLAAEITTDSQPGIAELVEVEGPGRSIFQFYSTMEAPPAGIQENRLGAGSAWTSPRSFIGGREARQILRGIPWLPVRGRYPGDRDLSHLQPRPPRDQRG
jgi:hypothetical protein